MEVARLKRGRKEEREEVATHTLTLTHTHTLTHPLQSSGVLLRAQVVVPRLHSVCADLRKEAEMQEQTNQLHSLPSRANQRRRTDGSDRYVPVGAGLRAAA